MMPNNALEQIEMRAHLSQNRELIQDVHEAVVRIQWALREVLPRSDSESGEDF